MKWLVVVAGTGLVAWGGYLHWTGWLIVQVERGWSSVIAGAVFLSAGMVMLTVAALMSRLDRIARSLANPGSGARSERAPATAPEPKSGSKSEPKSGSKPALMSETRSEAEAKSSSDRPLREMPPLGLRAFAPAEPPRTYAPSRVTRRYESQGVQYTLYEDGSIDAEADGSRHHFASIAELRAHLDRDRRG